MPDTDEAAALRPREEAEAGHECLRDRLDTIVAVGAYGEEYTRGQLAALAWVLGREPAPMTGQADVDVTNPYAIDRERLLATEMLYGRAELDRRGRDYVVGVEHTLMWVRNQIGSPL